MQDTGKFRTNDKDQFYTSPAVAKACIESVLKELPYTRQALWIEPSAGAGAFLKEVPLGIRTLGIDLEPKAAGIQQADFLEWQPPPELPMMKVYFGNPPFGRQGSLARRFLEKAGRTAQVMAFILPRSFMKPSMQTSIPLVFHLVGIQELEKNSFLVNEKPYDVPCVFQIWERRGTERVLEEKIPAVGYSYVRDETWDLAIRRVGGLAGRAFVKSDELRLAAQSHYFIKFDPPIDKEKGLEIKKILCSHQFPSNTTGPRSLSQSEVNTVLNPILETSAQSY